MKSEFYFCEGVLCRKPLAIRLSAASLIASWMGVKTKPKSISLFAASLNGVKPGWVSFGKLHVVHVQRKLSYYIKKKNCRSEVQKQKSNYEL